MPNNHRQRLSVKCLQTIFAFLLVCVLSVAALAVDGVGTSPTPPEAPSNLPSSAVFQPNQIKKEQGGQTASRLIGEADTPVCENARLALFVDEQRAVIKIQDKSNGYVWSSGLDEEDVTELTATWQRFSQALIVAEYIDRYAPTTPVREFPVIERIVKKPDGLEFHCLLKKLSTSLVVTVRLEDDGIQVSIPEETMLVKDDTVTFRLCRISVLPFLGAVKSMEADGYIFIPDGPGALIRFGPTKKYSLSYKARVYGKDFGIGRISEIESDFPAFQDMTAHLPVFGITHGNGDNAFVAVITGGEEYADISANPAGVRVDYFWGCPMFNYLEAYYQPTDTGKGFTYLPSQPNTVNASVSYKFLSGEQASYVGMANKYKSMLIESGALVKHTQPQSQIPLHLQAYMAEQEKGLIGNHTKALTTLGNVSDWIEDLKNDNIHRLTVSLTGFNTGGYSGSTVGDYRIEGKIGSDTQLRHLFEQLQQDNGQLLLAMNYGSVYEHQAKMSHFVTNIDHDLASIQDIGYLFDHKNFLSSRVMDDYMQQLDRLPDYKKNVLIQGLGSHLLSEYRKNNTRTRSEALSEVTQSLETAAKHLQYMGLEAPNAYAFRWADAIMNTPDTHSQYIYESDVVPFLQIVLSGYVDCFSTPLNFGSLTKDDVLRLIDFNLYPSYLLTDCLASEFGGTNVLDIYFSDYATIRPRMTEEYTLLNDILLPVYGQAIVDRTVVENGVSVVKYEGGIRVVINYNDAPFVYEGTTVQGKSAMRFGG